MGVSTADQNLSLQLHALRAAGCKPLFDDQASGAKADRRGLNRVGYNVPCGMSIPPVPLPFTLPQRRQTNGRTPAIADV